MKENIRALLVQVRHDPLDALRLALEEQSIKIFTARNCADAALALWSDCPPHLVFHGNPGLLMAIGRIS